MKNLLDDIELPREESTAIKRRVEQGAMEKLEEIEEQILNENLDILRQAQGWVDLDPEDPSKVPEAWIKQYGEEEAIRKHKIAYAARLSSARAPCGLHIAKDLAVGVMKARSQRGKNAPVQVNIGAIEIPIDRAVFTYPILEVEE